MKPQQQDSSFFSFQAKLLQLQKPMTFNGIRPQNQIQVSPKIDSLIKANLQINKYNKIYSIIQKEQEKRILQENLKKVEQQAKNALKKTKRSDINQVKVKWGHSIYKENNLNEQNNQKSKQNNHQIQNQQLIPSKLKPIQERIKQYKQKQIAHEKQIAEKQRSLKQSKLTRQKQKQIEEKIAKNAEMLVKQKQKQIQESLKRKQSIKNKISELQKESLQNVKKCKKISLAFQQGKQMNMELGDSKYSTFEARQAGRKMLNKKINKNTNLRSLENKSQQQNRIVAKTSSRRQLMQKYSKTSVNFNYKKQSNQKIALKSQKQLKISQQINQQQSKQQQQRNKNKKFYIWNIPIKQQDYCLLLQNKKVYDQYEKNKGKEVKKGFKQETQEYLRQKHKIKQQEQKGKIREVQFQMKVKAKMQQHLEQYDRQYPSFLDHL